jgi:hypothetical protein
MQNAECRMQKAAQSQVQAKCRPPASQEIGSCSLVFLLCCSCFPLVLRWCPPPHHGGSVEPQVHIDCHGRLVIHMQSDFSINPLRSAVLRPSRAKANTERKQKVESRKQKGGTNPSCGSASPGHSCGEKLGGLPLQARTSGLTRERSSPALGTMELDSTAEKGTVHEP